MSIKARLRDDIEALFTTSEHSWDGQGAWTNAHLRMALLRDPWWEDWYDTQAERILRDRGSFGWYDPLSSRISAVLGDMRNQGVIEVVTDRIAAPGGHSSGGTVYRLADDETWAREFPEPRQVVDVATGGRL